MLIPFLEKTQEMENAKRWKLVEVEDSKQVETNQKVNLLVPVVPPIAMDLEMEEEQLEGEELNLFSLSPSKVAPPRKVQMVIILQSNNHSFNYLSVEFHNDDFHKYFYNIHPIIERYLESNHNSKSN